MSDQVRSLLHALGFESEASAQVGTAAVGSKLFPAGHLKLFKIVGEPGTLRQPPLLCVTLVTLSSVSEGDTLR